MARKPITYDRIIRRDRKYKFFRFLFTLILIFAGVLFILHADQRLSEYEASQPTTTVKQFIQFLEENTGKSDFPDASVAPKDTIASLCAFADEHTLTFKEIIQPNKAEHHFNLSAGGKVIAELRLKQAPKKSGEVYTHWEISHIELFVSSEELAFKLLEKLQGGDFSFVADNTDPAFYPTETKADLSGFLLSETKDKTLTLSETDAPSADEKAYIYLLDDEPFFTVTMKKSASNPGIWEFSGCTPHFIRTRILTADLPAHITLYVNGAPAPKSLITQTTENEHTSRVAEDVVNPVDLSNRHYEIPFIFAEPVLSIKDSSGNDLPFTLEENKLVYTSLPSGVLPEFSFLEANIINATDQIARFFVGKAELRQVLKHVETDSKAHDIFQEYNMWKSLNAGSADMQNCEITDMVKLGDNCLAVQVNALFRARYTSTNVIDYPLDYTLYYHTVNNQWLIYDFISR